MRHPGQRLTGRDLHPQHELDLPPRFVQYVGSPVAGLGNPQRVVGSAGLLVEVEQLPRRQRAVDDVLAVIAGVVPTASDVEAVVAGAGEAGDGDVALVGGDPEVSSGPGVRLTDVLGLDLDAAAVVVEVLERVPPEIRVDPVADVERLADVVADCQAEGRPGLAEGAEVDQLDVVPGRPVGAVRLGLAGGNNLVAAVKQPPVEGGRCRGHVRRTLRPAGQIADLVDPHR
jgi:hypothetical protein